MLRALLPDTGYYLHYTEYCYIVFKSLLFWSNIEIIQEMNGNIIIFLLTFNRWKYQILLTTLI